MKVYLSSTLNDLLDERQAATNALVAAGWSIKDSYSADERSLRDSCLDDVAECDAYVLILGLRYGFVPPPATEAKSITLLEYERAKDKGLYRMVFVKKASEIRADKTDAYTGEHPKERIESFRSRFATGNEDEPRGAEFTTPEDLKYAVAQAVAKVNQQKSGTTTILSGLKQHPWQIGHDVSICTLPGTDDDLQLAALRNLDRRVNVFARSPLPENEYLPKLDEVARRSRCLMVVLRPQSLSRLQPQLPVVHAALEAVRHRSPVYALLVDVKRDGLPPALAGAFDDFFDSAASDWALANRQTTFERLTRWRRERVADVVDRPRIGVPYLVVALTGLEAEELRARTDTLFGRFGDATSVRRSVFDDLCKSLTTAGLKWPDGFYGNEREACRPFGPGTPTLEQFVNDAARKVNNAPQGSRERRVLQQAQLVPQRYRLEEYLQDAYGTGENLKRVADEGCLVLVDEFALLHPDLRQKIDALLSSNNAAVVSISSCDPAYRSLGSLLGELSYLRVGNLFTRFRESEDVRCELALNSVARLQRWLRFVLPELMITLGQQQSDPSLVNRADALLAR